MQCLFMTPRFSSTPQTPSENEGAPAALHFGVALGCLVYVLVCIALWYSTRGTWFGTSTTIPYLLAGGLVLFFGLCVGFRVVSWREIHKETAWVATSSIVLLVLLWEYGRRNSFHFWFGSVDSASPMAPLYPFYFFVACAILMRMVAPLLIGRLILGQNPLSYGYGFTGVLKYTWIYVLTLIVAIPLVIYASTLPAFLQKYPLCKQIIADNTLSVSGFIVYQLAYSLVFVSGESFWRGYMLFGLHRQLGANALFFMVIPYVISHFGKPWPETLGAVFTGLFLGSLALAHRSFWLGVVTHWGVALSMDLFAIRGRMVEWVP